MTGNMSWNPSPATGYSYGVNFSQYDINLSSGQTIQFNPISATNSCGTSSRSMAFQAFSGFAVYPNPTSQILYLKFDNAEQLGGLPEDVGLYEESSGKITVSS